MPKFYTSPQSHWVRDRNLWLDPVVGEAICQNLLDSETGASAYIPTGFFFEGAWQLQPDPQNLDGGALMADISDWAFATEETAQRIAELLGAEMPELNYARPVRGIQLSRYPYMDSKKQPLRPMCVALSSTRGGSIVINAGLVASTLARYFSYDPTSGNVRHSWEGALGDLIDELRDELEHSAEERISAMPALLPGNEKFAVGRS